MSSVSQRVLVVGSHGKMGRVCVAGVEAAADLDLAGVVASSRDDLAAVTRACAPDVAIEFTTPSAGADNLRTLLELGVPVVSGTTGIDADQRADLDRLARSHGIGFVLAPNFAIGVVLMQQCARLVARHLPDLEIVELHHCDKLDAPSGTAAATAAELREVRSADHGVDEPIPVHSVRLPGLIAHQEMLFGAEGQLLTLRHDTHDRNAFVPGVLLAVRKVGSLVGCTDSLEALLR